MQGGRITLRRTISAPREQVFRAWTDPDVLASWFGPGGFTIASATLDVRPGGAYEIVMQTPGGDRMPLVGTYHEVAAPERLVFTWSWSRVWAQAPESLVVVEFEESAEGTLIVVTQGDFGGDDEAAPYEAGWAGGLEKLEARLGAQEVKG